MRGGSYPLDSSPPPTIRGDLNTDETPTEILVVTVAPVIDGPVPAFCADRVVGEEVGADTDTSGTDVPSRLTVSVTGEYRSTITLLQSSFFEGSLGSTD